MTTLGESLQSDFDAWFKKLQALTNLDLVPEQWTGRWYDGYSLAAALADGPEDDDD